MKNAFATFAGGCFWCMEPPFRKVDGVIEVIPGYTGGTKDDPTYEEVSSGNTGHVEAVEVEYDPEKVAYDRLLDVFWRQTDPTDEGGQFADRGSQYRTAIFYHDEEQRKLAEESKKRVEERFKSPVATSILPASDFYMAEEYHRQYYRKNPLHYKAYKAMSGREGFVKRVWGEDDGGR